MLQITSCQEIIKIYNFYFIFVKYEICGLKNVLLPRCHYRKKENFGDSHFHNILSLFDVLPNFPFTTSSTKRDYLIKHI